jgi:hypothetical protein
MMDAQLPLATNRLLCHALSVFACHMLRTGGLVLRLVAPRGKSDGQQCGASQPIAWEEVYDQNASMTSDGV